MTYTPPLPGALGSSPVVGRLYLRTRSGQQVTASLLQASGPTPEQLTRATKSVYSHRGSVWSCGADGGAQVAELTVNVRTRPLATTDPAELRGVHMMYTITRGPSKLVTQRRTGPTQQVESKFTDLKLKPTSWLTSNSPPPKIVFNRPNGKRYHSAASPKAETSAEGFTPAHEENVRFVYEVWQEVEQKLEDRDSGESANSQGPVQYTEKTPSTAMKNFVPIDLEEWWAQRFLANIANLS